MSWTSSRAVRLTFSIVVCRVCWSSREDHRSSYPNAMNTERERKWTQPNCLVHVRTVACDRWAWWSDLFRRDRSPVQVEYWPKVILAYANTQHRVVCQERIYYFRRFVGGGWSCSFSESEELYKTRLICGGKNKTNSARSVVLAAILAYDWLVLRQCNRTALAWTSLLELEREVVDGFFQVFFSFLLSNAFEKKFSALQQWSVTAVKRHFLQAISLWLLIIITAWNVCRPMHLCGMRLRNPMQNVLKLLLAVPFVPSRNLRSNNVACVSTRSLSIVSNINSAVDAVIRHVQSAMIVSVSILNKASVKCVTMMPAVLN